MGGGYRLSVSKFPPGTRGSGKRTESWKTATLARWGEKSEVSIELRGCDGCRRELVRK